MWNELLTALALVMIIEGVMPFLSPARMRNSLQKIIEMDDGSLRTVGLVSMILGVALLYWVH